MASPFRESSAVVQSLTLVGGDETVAESRLAIGAGRDPIAVAAEFALLQIGQGSAGRHLELHAGISPELPGPAVTMTHSSSGDKMAVRDVSRRVTVEARSHPRAVPKDPVHEYDHREQRDVPCEDYE